VENEDEGYGGLMGKKKSDNGVEKIKKRVEVMIKERPSHKEVLEFFKDVVTEQYAIKSKVKTAPVEINEEDSKVKIMQGFPLVEKRALTLDVSLATRLFKRLCKILSRNKKASHDAEQITRALRKKEINFSELFKQAGSDNNDQYIATLSEKLGVKKDVLSFLARNSVKPIFEAYAKEVSSHVDQERWWKGYCPICGSEPLIAELREEGARFLVCSSCDYEWRFNRLKCPFCENDNHEKLRYFYTEKEGKTYRVDVCEKCKRYIKTIDTKELGEDIIPLIEDAGTLHLDILAQNEGYTREGKGSGLEVNA
jgi:FdhE protein